jgi:hypothetical protein
VRATTARAPISTANSAEELSVARATRTTATAATMKEPIQKRYIGGSRTDPGPTQPGHVSLDIDETAAANGQRQVRGNEKERIGASSAPDPQRRPPAIGPLERQDRPSVRFRSIADGHFEIAPPRPASEVVLELIHVAMVSRVSTSPFPSGSASQPVSRGARRPGGRHGRRPNEEVIPVHGVSNRTNRPSSRSKHTMPIAVCWRGHTVGGHWTPNFRQRTPLCSPVRRDTSWSIARRPRLGSMGLR